MVAHTSVLNIKINKGGQEEIEIPAYVTNHNLYPGSV